jgi:O-antigen/teichoic acid export membrane protein
LISKFNSILKSEYFKNVYTLASGTTIAQLIALISAPISYRIYERDCYGTLAQYLSISSIIVVFASLQYNQAIILVKNNEQAKKLFKFNQFLCGLISVITLLTIMLFNKQIINFFENDKLSIWIFFIPMSVFFNGINQNLRIWANRIKKYKYIATNSVLNALLVPFFTIGLGLYFKGAVFGLFIGMLIGQIIPPFILYLRLRNSLKIETNNKIEIKSILKEYKGLPLYALPTEFINNFTVQLPVYVLSSLNNGTEIVGAYNLAYRILNLPIQVVSSAIANVFKQKSSAVFHAKNDLTLLYKQTLKILFSIGIIPYLIILFLGEMVFGFGFENKWKIAGEIASIMSILFLFNFITGPLSYMYLIAKKFKEDLMIRIPMVILMYFALTIGIKYSLFVGLLSFVIVRVIFYIFILFRSYQFTKIIK